MVMIIVLLKCYLPLLYVIVLLLSNFRRSSKVEDEGCEGRDKNKHRNVRAVFQWPDLMQRYPLKCCHPRDWFFIQVYHA